MQMAIFFDRAVWSGISRLCLSRFILDLEKAIEFQHEATKNYQTVDQY